MSSRKHTTKKKKPSSKPVKKSKKELEQERLNELYQAEREGRYKGAESFLNTLHPFEETGKNAGKKSSPVQKAMIECIKANGGRATEEQLLESITKHWKVIKEKMERPIADEPSIRLIRLNLAVKKRGRRLFLRDPQDSNYWTLNSKPRKISKRRRARSLDPSPDSDSEEENEEEKKKEIFETQIFESQEERLKKLKSLLTRRKNDGSEWVMPENTFELHLEQYMKKVGRKVTLNEAIEALSEYEGVEGLFHFLPHARRVFACLVALKWENQVLKDEEGKWFYSSLNEATTARNNAIEFLDGVRISDMTISEFYERVQKHTEKEEDKN